MIVRPAGMDDLAAIVGIINQAREYLKSCGVDQWQGDYPGEADIVQDIKTDSGYALVEGEQMAGYVCISFDGEPSYNDIQGRWKSGGQYAVIHRMAMDDRFRGKGATRAAFEYAEQLCEQRGVKSIKVDTDEANKVMQHTLSKYGYEYCGVVKFAGSDKIAFEKLL